MYCREYVKGYTKHIKYVYLSNLVPLTYFNTTLILEQWFLTFSKSGNTFDYMKNLRNTKINDPKNKQKHAA